MLRQLSNTLAIIILLLPISGEWLCNFSTYTASSTTRIDALSPSLWDIIDVMSPSTLLISLVLCANDYFTMLANRSDVWSSHHLLLLLMLIAPLSL